MKQKYTVTVAGMTVNIISDEQEEYVNGLVRLLDQRIEEMVSGNKRCSKTEAILFCAIDYFDDKIKNSLRFQHMQETIEKLEAENASLRAMLGMPAHEQTAEDTPTLAEETAALDEAAVGATAEKSAEKPAEKSAEKPAEKSATGAAAKSAAKSAAASAEGSDGKAAL